MRRRYQQLPDGLIQLSIYAKDSDLSIRNAVADLSEAYGPLVLDSWGEHSKRTGREGMLYMWFRRRGKRA